jgi:hypothetical protein
MNARSLKRFSRRFNDLLFFQSFCLRIWPTDGYAFGIKSSINRWIRIALGKRIQPDHFGPGPLQPIYLIWGDLTAGGFAPA